MDKEHVRAINCYKKAIRKADLNLKLILYSNMSQVYSNMEQWEDALFWADKAVYTKKDHDKSLMRRAWALANFGKFDEATEVFRQKDTNCEVKLDLIDRMRAMAQGDYKGF